MLFGNMLAHVSCIQQYARGYAQASSGIRHTMVSVPGSWPPAICQACWRAICRRLKRLSEVFLPSEKQDRSQKWR